MDRNARVNVSSVDSTFDSLTKLALPLTWIRPPKNKISMYVVQLCYFDLSQMLRTKKLILSLLWKSDDKQEISMHIKQ